MRRILSVLLSMCVICGIFPVTTFAHNVPHTDEKTEYIDETINCYDPETGSFCDIVDGELLEENACVPEMWDGNTYSLFRMRNSVAEAEYQIAENAEPIQGSFADAVNNVYNGGTIWLLQDVYLTQTVSISRNIKIISHDETAPKKLTCTINGHGYLLNVASGVLTLENVIVDGGYDFESENTVYGQRALIAVNGGNLMLNHGSEICNNYNTTASGAGGGICLITGRVVMDGGNIHDNHAYYGGGVAIIDGEFAVTDGGISANTAEAYGGGVYLSSGAFAMTAGTISKNTAGKYGGGVYQSQAVLYTSGKLASSSDLTITGGEISQNEAYMCAGMYISGSNKTEWDGTGGPWGTTKLANVELTGNTATLKGGGVLVAPYQDVMVSGAVRIYDNIAPEHSNFLLDNDVEYAYLPGVMVVDEALTDDALLYVDVCEHTTPYEEVKQLMAVGNDAYTITQSDFGKFKSDNALYTTEYGTDSNVYLVPHEYMVWVGGQGMFASTDGTVVSYYTNGIDGAEGVVTPTEPEKYHAKLYYDTAVGAYTLEINGLDVVGVANDADSLGAGIYSTVPLTIYADGVNDISGSTYLESGQTYGNSYGIYSPGIVFEGTEQAKITITAPDVKGSSYGVYATDNVMVNAGNITVNAGETINISSVWDFHSMGVYVSGGLTINDGVLNATTKRATRRSAGVYVVAPVSSASTYALMSLSETEDPINPGNREELGNIDIFYSNMQKVDSSGSGLINSGNDMPMASEGGICVNGGTLNASGMIGYASGAISAYSSGIYTEGEITINDGTVYGTAGSGGTTSEGIYSALNITINGGTVSGIGGDSGADQSRGIFSNAVLTIKDGMVTGTAGNSNQDFSQGVGGYDGIVISGGSVNATGGEGLVSVGLYSDWDLTVSGDAEIWATASTANVYSYGTWCWRNFHMSGTARLYSRADATTTENSGSRPRRSIGFYMSDSYSESNPPYIDDTFVITGGTFEAMCTTSDESTSTENYAFKMYDVINNAVVFSDTAQPNEKWYLWTLDADGDPANEYKSSKKTYIHDDDEENYKSRYLYIAPMELTHNVTFDSMGGSDVEPNPVEVADGETVAEPDPEPTKDGFSFVGWYTSEDDGETLSDEPYDFDTPVTDDITLYAKWVPLYTVTYDLNGGTGADGVDYTAKTVLAGTEITVNDAPTRSEYTFSGYSYGVNIYNPGDKLIVNTDVVLTAQWTENSTPSSGGGGSISRGTVVLVKVDANDSTTVLENVEFKLYKSNGTLVGTHATDKNGKITVNRLQTGTYYWLETRPAEGYVLDHTKHEFQIVRNKITEMTITNRRSSVPDAFRSEHYAYVIGYPDGTVRPEFNITRAEVATIFFRLLNDETREANLRKTNSFRDVDSDSWYNTAISTMANMGIVKGYPDGEFKPNETITRAEFAAIAARFDNKLQGTGVTTFADIVNHWAENEVNKAVSNGWILGYEDDTFRPEKNITRAETMTLVNRVLQRIPESAEDMLDGMIEWPDNAKEEAWYYLAVQEATNSHEYTRKANGYEKWTKLTETFDWDKLEK